ncbi:putative Zn(II)2Cys6 transcription factor [Aspergillus carlsbadensis]|nr:putative Zn(II)2Cys6 transcription factor [Aspergillus carlsbadensis]
MTEKRPNRSRNGCITCRIRRVKCDEERPHCQRCQSTGRKCDGYVPPQQKQQQVREASAELRIIQHTPQVTIPTHMWMFPAVNKMLNEDEYRSLEFFHAQTISCFGARAGGSLLNAACHDAGTRLAVIALGTMHRLVLYQEETLPHIHTRGMQLALQQYNSAIRRGLSHFPRDGADGSADGILSMCLLFFCFESLQGHFRAALRHGAAGLRILAQQQSEGRLTDSALLPPDVIYSMFTGLEGQMLEIDGQSPLSNGIGPLIRGLARPQQPMWTLEEVNDCFRPIYNDFLRLFSFANRLEDPHIDKAEMARLTAQVLAGYRQIQEDMDAWTLKFDYFLSNIFRWDSADSASQQLVRMLQLWHRMVGVILHMGSPPSETVWDNYTSDFTAMLDLADEIIAMSPPVESRSGSPSPLGERLSTFSPSPSIAIPKHESPQPTTYTPILPRPLHTTPSRFSISLGIIPALWMIATHCRDSRARYRAIDLLGRSNRREGVWDSILYSRLARQIARHEERAAGLDVGAMYTPESIPPEARVTIDGRLEEGRRASVAYMRGNVRFEEEVFSW